MRCSVDWPDQLAEGVGGRSTGVFGPCIFYCPVGAGLLATTGAEFGSTGVSGVKFLDVCSSLGKRLIFSCIHRRSHVAQCRQQDLENSITQPRCMTRRAKWSRSAKCVDTAAMMSIPQGRVQCWQVLCLGDFPAPFRFRKEAMVHMILLHLPDCHASCALLQIPRWGVLKHQTNIHKYSFFSLIDTLTFVCSRQRAAIRNQAPV